MTTGASRMDREDDFAIEPKFKFRLAFALFYIPLARLFITLVISGLVTYGISVQINANLSNEVEQGQPPKALNGSTSERTGAFQCFDVISCGILAVVIQLSIVLPLALMNLSSGCAVLSQDPIKMQDIMCHQRHLLLWSLIAICSVICACFISWDDEFVLLTMTPILALNMVDMWYLSRLIWQISEERADQTWDAPVGNDLIATNEQWLSLTQWDLDEMEVPATANEK